MADRTFHKRFTLTARIGVAVFAILAPVSYTHLQDEQGYTPW